MANQANEQNKSNQMKSKFNLNEITYKFIIK